LQRVAVACGVVATAVNDSGYGLDAEVPVPVDNVLAMFRAMVVDELFTRKPSTPAPTTTLPTSWVLGQVADTADLKRLGAP
jgi:hypothetical protein